jgi:hypothetical protein
MVNQKSGGRNGNLLAPFLFSAFPLRLRVILCLFTLNFQLLANKKRGSKLRPLLLTQPPQSAIYGRSA